MCFKHRYAPRISSGVAGPESFNNIVSLYNWSIYSENKSDNLNAHATLSDWIAASRASHKGDRNVAGAVGLRGRLYETITRWLGKVYQYPTDSKSRHNVDIDLERRT
jgi:hypothetical protein